MKTPHTASPRDHLEAVGKAIYGESWKAPIARELKVDLRTLRRWASDASDLAWDHGAIADLRAILADEHAEAVRDEAELREALEDLNMSIRYHRMNEAGGGDEMDAWGSYGDWNMPGKQRINDWPITTTPAEFAALVGRLRAQLHKETMRVRDLENQIAVLKKPTGMHFKISAGD